VTEAVFDEKKVPGSKFPSMALKVGRQVLIRHSIRQQSGVVTQPPRLGNPLGNPVQGCGAIPMDRQVK
jgi:hypothetical protein